MPPDIFSAPFQKQKFLLPFLAGGFVAGSMDLTAAFILYGWAVPRAIASGLLGESALHGGLSIWMLGVVLHFVIAFSAAAVYVISSRKVEFLRDHFLVCGLFYGIGVFLVMNLIVLPLSAVPWKIGPFPRAELTQGLLVHMFCIGMPIALSTRRFSK